MRKLPAVLLLVFAALPAWGAGQAASGQTEAKEYERRLVRVRQDIEALRRKLAEESQKEQSVLSQLDRQGVTRSLLTKELRLLGIQLEKSRADLAETRRNIPVLEAGLARERESLKRVLVTLYKFGRFSFVRFLLEAHDLRTLAAESKRLTALASSQDRLIGDYIRHLAALGRTAETLTAQERQTAALIDRTSSKKSEIEQEVARSRALVAQIRADKKTHEQTLAELARRAQELQNLIQKFEKQVLAAPFPMSPLLEKKGRLPWPAAGRLLQLYGPQRHPQFRTVTMNNGIEIAPESDALDVRAVHAGRIAYAENFPAYGNLIIINHGSGYYSLYGHLSEFLVVSGEYVQAGQIIGIAGDTGSLLGTSLYFEIRQQAKPVDPLQWLSRR